MHHYPLSSMFRVLGVYCLLTCLAASASLRVNAKTDDLGNPNKELIASARMINTYLLRHLSNRRLSDEMSHRAMDLYLKNLDPMKMYFMQADVDEFGKLAPRIGETFKEGKLDIAFVVFKRYMQRVDERAAKVADIVNADHDFSVDEYLVTDRKLISYAANEEEMRDRWRQRIKYNLLLYENDEKAFGRDPKERLIRRYQSYANRMHNYKNEDVAEVYITSITNSFDPHTSYLAKSTFESFLINMRLELEGIGATLRSTDDGLTEIVSIVAEGAADRQGELKVEDKIVAVGQVDASGNLVGEMIDITDWKLDEVVQMIRGKAGTTVRLGVLSANNEVKTIDITREKVELKDSAAKGEVFDAGQKANGEPYKIGVIDLPSFYADMGDTRTALSRSTTRDVARILEGFNRGGVDCVVLDLRRNGGGSLREAIDCTGLFIDRGPVVQIKDFIGNTEALEDTTRGMAWTGPLVVLTSRFSASASEILAGAIKDYHRGIVVGDTTTHGKGTVQTLVDLSEEFYRRRVEDKKFGALKLTIQQFYRPNGDSTQLKGVPSDVVLPSIVDHMDINESDLDYPVDFHQIPSSKYTILNHVSAEIISELGERSAARVSESEYFSRLQTQIQKYLEQKNSKRVTLNREAFQRQRADFDAEEADKDTFESQLSNDTAIKRTPYLDEVFNITIDYLQLAKDKLAQRN